MSKVIKISDEMYEKLNTMAFINRVSITDLATEAIKHGLSNVKNNELLVKDRFGNYVNIEP